MLHFATTILNAIFPPLCVHCRREGAWLCPAAETRLRREASLIDPLTIPGVHHVLVRCSYDVPIIAQLVQQIKYHFWHASGDILTEILAPLVPHLPRQAAIVPVPLHVRRFRERGFNQSDLIAKALSKLTNLPVAHLLRRVRYTPPQAKLSAQARAKNIIGAMQSADTQTWPRAVILVDDVITTGSTIAECAAVLRQHGVRTVIAVAIAKG